MARNPIAFRPPILRHVMRAKQSVQPREMDCKIHIDRLLLNAVILETGMERDEDGAVLGSTRLSGSQRLHR
jgi:hypothetical protein